jgi:hypothetical protein
VADQKPPRLAAAERVTILALLQFQRDSFIRKVTGVDDRQAKTSFVSSGTSLLWLTNHMADAESMWVLRRFGRRTDDDEPAAPGIGQAVARYRRVSRQVDAVIEETASLDELCPRFDNQVVNVRWILAHLLEETARHAGHADILRELIDGQTGR